MKRYIFMYLRPTLRWEIMNGRTVLCSIIKIKSDNLKSNKYPHAKTSRVCLGYYQKPPCQFSASGRWGKGSGRAVFFFYPWNRGKFPSVSKWFLKTIFWNLKTKSYFLQIILNYTNRNLDPRHEGMGFLQPHKHQSIITMTIKMFTNNSMKIILWKVKELILWK